MVFLCWGSCQICRVKETRRRYKTRGCMSMHVTTYMVGSPVSRKGAADMAASASFAMPSFFRFCKICKQVIHTHSVSDRPSRRTCLLASRRKKKKCCNSIRPKSVSLLPRPWPATNHNVFIWLLSEWPESARRPKWGPDGRKRLGGQK